MSKRTPSTVFGMRLRNARLRAEIPQDRLGVMIGLDEATASARMSRYETGVHTPPFEIVQSLGKVLSVPTAYFFCEDESLADLVSYWGTLKKTDREKALHLLRQAFADE